jgi:iron(III) transport system substrate-binding protein
VSGIAAPKGQISISEINPPNIDLSNLSDLEGTLELLQQAGLL